jgi:phosphohistidine phosphatase
MERRNEETVVRGLARGPEHSPVKTLHLLRHAKSDWSDASLSDHERPLNRRGKRARKMIQEHIDGWTVDLVICSTARRARATARPVIEALGCPARYEDAIYAASGRELLELARALPDDYNTVMLVGHNPSLEELTTTLCGSSPRYPTAALGTIELTIKRWADIAPGCGTVAAYVTPAELAVDE